MGQYCSVIYNAGKRAVYFSVQEVVLTLAITHAHHLVITLLQFNVMVSSYVHSSCIYVLFIDINTLHYHFISC